MQKLPQKAPSERATRSAFPSRRTYAWAALAFTAFAFYASLIPFELHRVPLESAVAGFRTILTEASPHISRTNFLANILMFVPLGFCLAGALLLDRAGRLAALPVALAVLPVSVAVSLTVEFLQMFTPGRTPARHDVVAQTIGCAIGIAAWVATGPALTAWLRAASSRSRGDRFARLLAAYGVAWIFVNLAPFDIVLHPGTLAERVRSGHITIVPPGPGEWSPHMAWEAFATTISAVPLGIYALVGWTGRGTRRSAPSAFAFGAALVLIVEGAQIFIRSHVADTADVLFGWLGIAVGVLVGARVLSRNVAIARPGSPAISRWAATAFAMWCIVLCAYHWLPYDFVFDTAAIERQLDGISLVPFEGYRAGSELKAFNNLLVKLGLAAPLGVLAAFISRGPRGRANTTAGWLALSAVVFATVEAGQFLLPSRVPDPTDVLVGICGTALGLWLGRWLRHGTR